MDELLKIMLANPSLSIRLDTFLPSKSLRLKFMADQQQKEAYVNLSALAADPFILGEEATRLAERMKLKPAAAVAHG